jgi:hypothetical protein
LRSDGRRGFLLAERGVPLIRFVLDGRDYVLELARVLELA